jgi:enoyl-CoA hydratase/carnithine racemase
VLPGLVTNRIDGDTATVTIANPRTRNAVSRAVHHEMTHVLRGVADDPAVRFVVLRGSDGIFSSGGDLTELAEGLSEDYVADYWTRMTGTVLALRSMSQIVVSVIEGAAVGAGAALALAADIVVAEPTARFKFSFVHLGLMPDAGASWILPRLVGPVVARDLLLTGRWLSAEEAYRRGLVARLCGEEGIDAAVESLFAELRYAPAETLAQAKNMLEAHAQADFASAVRAEGQQQKAAAATGHYLEILPRIINRSKRARRTAG